MQYEPKGSPQLIEMTADIVSAYVSRNPVAVTEIPTLIERVHAALAEIGVGRGLEQRTELRPAVPVKKSVTDDYIVCLEDGLKFKSLRRHLRSRYNMTPEQYREKWDLPPDYPMVSPNYARQRSDLARKSGLGRNKKT
jgi:predicted transcriptional regulator